MKLAQYRELASAVVRHLPDEMDATTAQGWIDNPRALAKFLAGLCPPKGQGPFPVWKTLTLGTGPKNANGFRRALKSGGFRIGDRGNDILGKSAFTVSPKDTEVDLVVVTVSQLGFREGATRENIYKRAHELGLSLCPAEVGPQLRLAYKDQPQGEWCLIGMEPITDSDGYPCVFVVVAKDGTLRLIGRYSYADDYLVGGSLLVFVRRK